jgi:uncharacterized protein YjbI with pentapeptide repeats
MAMRYNYIEIFSSLVTDASKIIDKKDLLKDFLDGNDEFLSASSWGVFVKHLGKQAFEISDVDEAYHFAIYTTYTNSVLDALEHYGIKINSLAIPKVSKGDYPCESFDIDSFSKNELVKYFEDEYKIVFDEKELSEDEIKKVLRHINNNLKLNYFKLLDKEEIVLGAYNKYVNSNIFQEENLKFKKAKYKAELEKEYLNIVLNDEKGLTLQNLYIEPYFRVHQNCFKEDDTRVKDTDKRDDKFIDVKDVSIHDFIVDTLDGKNKLGLKNDGIDTIFISGFPGQGKSSFVKRFVYDAINEVISLDQDVICIKLKDIEEPKELLGNDISQTLKKHIPFEVENLENYIVLLDGLDELYMKSGLSLSDIDAICAKLSRKKIKTIVTTRHHYVNFDKMNEKTTLILSLKELDKTQQKEWLVKYKTFYPHLKLTDEIIDALHENKDANKHILELINQPILLHMIASMDIEHIEKYNKNKLYKEFFDILIERKWEKEQHTLFDGLKKTEYEKMLRGMLQELAINIFQSEFEYIHRVDFEELQSVKNFKRELEKIQNQSLHDGLKGVMVAFYFQEVRKDAKDNNKKALDENYAIEFLHKSLMEYMVAEYIWEEMQSFLDKNERTGKYFIDEEEEALKTIWSLFSSKNLTDEVYDDLKKIVENFSNQDEKDELSDRIGYFMDYFLEKDFLYEYSLDDINPIEKSLNCFGSSWNFYQMLNYENKVVPHIQEKLVKTLKVFKSYYKNSMIDISNCIFIEADFDYMNFEYFNMRNTEIKNTSMANISFARVYTFNTNIKMTNSRIIFSDIWELKFHDNDISDISIEVSMITNMQIFHLSAFELSFSDSIINALTIEEVNFIECSFKQSIFRNDNHYNSTFKNVIFENCEFEDSVFINCEFKNINLSKEELEDLGARFIDCTFENDADS